MNMRIDVFSIFPDLIESFTSQSLIGRARRAQLVDLRTYDLRDAATDRHRSVDDSPFGGGPGMVLKPEPIFLAVEANEPPRPLLLLSPSGRMFDQSYASELADLSGFSLLCGRYEGVDHRVRTHLVDGEVSIGDFVVSGGEIAALAMIEAVARLLPGVMGNDESGEEESFSGGLLEYPQWTRPWDFRGMKPPEILLSGDHGLLQRWRQAKSLEMTLRLRPDLIECRGGLTSNEEQLLTEFGLT